VSLGSYLRDKRLAKQFTLRDVKNIAKNNQIGVVLSSGYMSMLERGVVKAPAPRILFA